MNTSYMNTYQGGRNTQGKIILIKHYFASLIFGIISPLVGSGPLVSVHTRLHKVQKYWIYKSYLVIKGIFKLFTTTGL